MAPPSQGRVRFHILALSPTSLSYSRSFPSALAQVGPAQPLTGFTLLRAPDRFHPAEGCITWCPACPSHP